MCLTSAKLKFALGAAKVHERRSLAARSANDHRKLLAAVRDMRARGRRVAIDRACRQVRKMEESLGSAVGWDGIVSEGQQKEQSE